MYNSGYLCKLPELMIIKYTYTPEQLNMHVPSYYNYNGYSLEKFPQIIEEIKAAEKKYLIQIIL